METWKILLITFASAVVLGCIAGVVLGKRQIKKMSGQYKPLLSVKERVIYSVCILLGAGFILFGVFFKFPTALGSGSQIIEGNMFPGGVNPGMENNPAVEAFAGANVADAETGDGSDENAGEDDQDTGEESDESNSEEETEEAATPTVKPAPRASGGGVMIDRGVARAVIIG